MKPNLARIFLLGALAGLAHPAFAQPADPSRPPKQFGKSPVKVFIFADQSNMQGQGVSGIGEEFRGQKGTLVAMLADPVKAPLAALLSLPVLGADNPPDLTQGETSGVDRARTYNLGATGLRGWIYTKPANFFESCQGRTTTASRQILVTHVGEKSPADGVMKVDDVILGTGGKHFAADARKSMAAAIQEAEKKASGGILKLTRWRAGKTEEVQLKLRVLGAYSDTAPYECPKSKRIFADACKVLEKEPLHENLWGAVNGLALMATGNPDYLPRVREFARKMAPKTLKLELRDGMVTWEWGYRNLFLCEYYLLTNDQDVLHAINQYTIALAKGQSMYGTFGHGVADRNPDGTLHGSIPPYGPVNATGLIANLAIVMGKKCGVEHPEVDAAIDRGAKFFGYYVDKGAIPYGEHMPWPYHENNGKNAMTAVLFAAQGNRIEEAQFFAKMVTASYENREYGHTGMRTSTIVAGFTAVLLVGMFAAVDLLGQDAEDSILEKAESRLRAIYEHGEFRAKRFRAGWLPDGSGYTVSEQVSGAREPVLVQYDAASGERTALDSPRKDEGGRNGDISPNANWAFHTYSTFDLAPVTELVQLPGHPVVRLLEDNQELRKKMDLLISQPTEFVQLDIGGGVIMDAWMIKPNGFDLSRKYPVLVYVYGEHPGQRKRA